MIILIGPSASGKTEVVKELVNKGYTKLVTYTTREKRIGEIEGRDYHFITTEDFKSKIINDLFFEYVEYNNNLYGTLKEDITDNKVVILEPNGFKKYHESGLSNIISFFLSSSKEKRIERMNMRKDDAERIKERILSDDTVFNIDSIEGIDYIIDSDNLTIKEMSDEINDLYKRKLNKK